MDNYIYCASSTAAIHFNNFITEFVSIENQDIGHNLLWLFLM
jgi:hypothetical protein